MVSKINKQIFYFILIISIIPLSFGKGSNTFIEDKVFVTNTKTIVEITNLHSSIYDPLGNDILKLNDIYNKKILNLTDVPNIYSNPDSILSDYNLKIIKQFNYETGNSLARKGEGLKYNCQIGGQYTIDGYYNTGDRHHESCGKGCTLEYRSVTKIPTNLFYCKTTKDLFDQVKIPQSWINDKIIIYCNNGANTNFKEFNIDFLTTKLDTYNSCIIKNLDLPQNNTIIYSFEKGNPNIDSKTKEAPLIQQIFENENPTILFNMTTNITTINDTKTNKIFKSTKINETSLFTLYDVNDFSNPIPISDIIDSSKFKLTRPILAKSFDSSKKLIGYENILKTEFPDLTKSKEYNSAMYKIKFLGFGNIKNMCMDSLGKYGAKETLAESQSIICSSNTIKINDYQISNRYNTKGFNVFKNIILDTND